VSWCVNFLSLEIIGGGGGRVRESELAQFQIQDGTFPNTHGLLMATLFSAYLHWNIVEQYYRFIEYQQIEPLT